MCRLTRLSQWTTGFTVLWLMLRCGPACAQVSASPEPPAKSSSMEDSVRALAGEIKELGATIQELRAEVSRSRQETSELREELHGAMVKLSTMNPPAVGSAKAAVSPASAAAPPAPAVAVAAPPAAPTSTEARLNQVEEDQQLLQAKVDEQHQTKVESASKYRVKLSGIALINLFGNSGTVDNQDIPNMALPPGALATSGSVGATVRQSEIGLQAYGPDVAGARVSGQVNLDFMGGFSNTTNGVTDPLVRLRTAAVRMDWSETSVVAGQEAPFFSPLSPTSLAALGYPALADAGNLWTWTPQVRIDHTLNLSSSNRLLLQVGALDPLSGEAPASQYYRAPDGGEQSRKPAVASRLAWTHGSGEQALTLGLGGYYSRQNYGAGRTVDAWAGTADWNLPMGHRFALSGEFYRGRALGGLGGAEGRSVLFGGPESTPTSEVLGLDTIGGWTQLKFKATEMIELNAAFGMDNPFAQDLRYFSAPTSYAYTAVAKNQNALFNVIYRPRGDLLLALEYRYLDTLQTSNRMNTAGTVNLSMGLLF